MTKTKGTLEWACKNINFSLGCSNDCKYCYAKAIAHRFGWKKREDWKNMILKPEMFTKKFKKFDGWIMSPSSHDITLENISLAVKVFQNILEAGNKLLIVTKPDEDWIRFLARNLFLHESELIFRFTITTLYESSRSYWETNAPLIISRYESLEYVYSMGLQTSVAIEPFLDNSVVDLVKMIHPYVTENIWIGPMNFTHVPKEYIKERNQEQYYTPENLRRLKKEIDALGFDNIRYKDAFLNKIKEDSL